MASKIFLTIIFFMIFTSKYQAQSKEINEDLVTIYQAQSKEINEDLVTIDALMAVQEALWNEGRIEDFMSLYWKNDSMKFIGSKGITYGWQKTLDNYKKSYPDKKAMGELKFTVLETKQLSDNYIYVIGKWELKKDKPSGGHFTLLWQKINGNWVIVADHTS